MAMEIDFSKPENQIWKPIPMPEKRPLPVMMSDGGWASKRAKTSFLCNLIQVKIERERSPTPEPAWWSGECPEEDALDVDSLDYGSPDLPIMIDMEGRPVATIDLTVECQ